MRELTIGTSRHTTVICTDESGEAGKGFDGHEYIVVSNMEDKTFTKISFQKGPVKETGVNGCHNEDLIAVVIDRLQGFQGGESKCRENAIAITKLEEALLWLSHRTNMRIARGVEGTSKK